MKRLKKSLNLINFESELRELHIKIYFNLNIIDDRFLHDLMGIGQLDFKMLFIFYEKN